MNVSAADTTAVKTSTGTSSTALTKPTPRALLKLGTGYLRVLLFQGVSVLLPMAQVQEVIALPSHRLSALPNLPAPVLGLMNRRSQVLWLVDLAYVLGIGRLELDPQVHHVVVLKVGKLTVGFAATAIEGMVSIPNDALISIPSQVPPSSLPYLRACARIPGTDPGSDPEILLVLNPDALLQAPVLQINP